MPFVSQKMRKNLSIMIFSLFLLAFAASAYAADVQFSVRASGSTISVMQNETQTENCTFNNETNSTDCVNQTYIMNTTVKEPWEKTIDLDIECGNICSYPMPSFNPPDGVQIDKYAIISNLNVYFESTKAKTTGNPEDKIVVEVQPEEKPSELVLDRILPSTISEGASKVNVFVTNNGSDAVSYFNLSIIGSGISGGYGESYDKIEPSGMAIVPVSLNATAGQNDVVVKISWASNSKVYSAIYTYKLNVVASQNEPEAKVNSTEITNRFNADKDRLRDYEANYSVKKSEGYPVSEVYDSIKDAKDYVASIQLLIEEGKYSDAKLKLALLELSLDDIGNGLQNALKTQQTFADRLKNNALLISAIITAIAGLITFYERQKIKVKRLKEKIASKKAVKTEKPEQAKAAAESKKRPKKKSVAKKPKERPEEEMPSQDDSETF